MNKYMMNLEPWLRLPSSLARYKVLHNLGRTDKELIAASYTLYNVTLLISGVAYGSQASHGMQRLALSSV